MESSENSPLQKIQEEELQAVTGGSDSWKPPTELAGASAASLAVGGAIGYGIARWTKKAPIVIEAPATFERGARTSFRSDSSREGARSTFEEVRTWTSPQT
jgi:hypothetical protein